MQEMSDIHARTLQTPKTIPRHIIIYLYRDLLTSHTDTKQISHSRRGWHDVRTMRSEREHSKCLIESLYQFCLNWLLAVRTKNNKNSL